MFLGTGSPTPPSTPTAHRIHRPSRRLEAFLAVGTPDLDRAMGKGEPGILKNAEGWWISWGKT